MAFQVGDRVKINASGWDHWDTHWYAFGRKVSRDDVFDITDEDTMEPDRLGRFRVFGGSDLVGWFDAEHLEPAYPAVLDRLAGLAEDPAMLPVLEAFADYCDEAQRQRKAIELETKMHEAVQTYLRGGAEC